MEDQNQAIYNYFMNELNEGKSEFRLAVTKTENGFSLLVHPNGKDGKTLDLYIEKHTYSSFNFGKN